MTAAKKGTVYLVGAGPGDPELLTLKALRLLETADVILHDDLVPDAVLTLAHRHALVTSVGKRCGRPRITQAGIHALMIDSARADQSVVRLKSGDPLVFGRAGEELAALRAANIPHEIVPGVTAALAAGAALQVPLTDRSVASKLVFCTGHHAAGKAGDTPLWSGQLPNDATLLVYMPGRDLRRLQRELLQAGLPADMPCCAIAHAATPQQTHTTGRLHLLDAFVCGSAPLLIAVGHVLEALISKKDQQLPGDIIQAAKSALEAKA